MISWIKKLFKRDIYILYIDDLPTQRASLRSVLEASGYKVDCPQGIKTQDLIEETRKLLDTCKKTYDVIIIDMEYTRDLFGGLKVLEVLEEDSYKNRRKNIIIYSALMNTGTNETKEIISKALADRNYPMANLLPRNQKLLLDRIKKLLAE